MASINKHGSCYGTALSLSTQRGNETTITYFLNRCNIGPNASCRGCDGAAPLHLATQSLRVNVSILISKWNVNVNSMDRYKRTPLHLMVSAILSPRDNFGRGEIITKELVAAGAQLSAKDTNGYTPRDLFKERKNIDQEKEEALKNMNLRKLLAYG